MDYPQLKRAIEVISRLRDPKDGCPWDLEQTHESLLKYLIEESYEYIHAVEEKNVNQMKDELGDVLLQILLHSKIASEQNHFDIEDVAKSLADKMIRRHPHVFQDKSIASNSNEVVENWKKIKNEENKQRSIYYFSEKDLMNPPLIVADEIGAKSQEVNFDWDNVEQVWDKVKEELQEVRDEIDANNHDAIEDEIGDLLFSVTQLARHLNVSADKALKRSNKKFIERFKKLEDFASSNQIDIKKQTTEQLEVIWQKIKVQK